MRVEVRAFHTHKAGNARDEYEDAFWPDRSTQREVRAFRCAVADGATETSFAAIWARLLVRAFCRGEFSERRLPRTLPLLAGVWRREVGTRPLPWYAEEKVRDGAFSSLLGLSLHADECDAQPEYTDRAGSGGTLRIVWNATAIGDSCVFQTRDDALIAGFPLAESAAFNSRPCLLGTNPSRNGDLTQLVQRSHGEARTGDTFFLMTDALAAWFLRECEAGGRPWCDFTNGEFSEWIAELRDQKSIRNDDVTLLTLRLL